MTPRERADAILMTRLNGLSQDVAEAITAAEREARAAHRRALDAAGWQIVPKEATDVMAKAGWDCDDSAERTGIDYMVAVWRAMLAAAPEVPT